MHKYLNVLLHSLNHYRYFGWGYRKVMLVGVGVVF